MTLIDGKKVADQIKEEIGATVEKMVAEGKKRPHLAAILVGHDGGSETYVAHKVRACEQCGFKSTLIRFEDDVTEEKLLEAIETLNRDADVDGFIVQLPPPAPHLRTENHRGYRLSQGCRRLPSYKRKAGCQSDFPAISRRPRQG